MYHISRFSTAFSVKLIHLSAKTANILHPFTFPFYTITETPDFCVKVYFCLIVRFFPQSPSYQRHLKTRKNGVHQPFQCTPPSLKTLDFKPFFNTFACEYQKSYGINLRKPPVPLLYFDDFYPSLPHLPHPIRHSTNGIRQNPLAFMRSSHIRAALKAVPTHATRPYLMWSVWYQTAKNGFHGKMIKAFPHFQLLRRSLRLRPNTVSL